MGEAVLGLAIQTAMVDTVLGRYRPFTEHLESALAAEAAERGLEAGGVEAAMEIAGGLPPFPDTEPALQALADAGWSLAVLTNSGAEAGRSTLEAAGLASRFDRILGVDAVEAFKPSPATYRYALEELRVRPPDVVFVAAHAWDVTGAADAGMRTALVLRGHRRPPVFPEPDFAAEDLRGLAAAIAQS